LEPNKFSITKELQDPALWLTIGFGRPVLTIAGADIGLEALGWSRLRVLSGFRFPVETADYFFGMYAAWGSNDSYWRARISHISSHLVDGTDSAMIGGASSKYSREFMELDHEAPLDKGKELYLSSGVRVLFHQVTKEESWISVPVSLSWRFARYGPTWYLDSAPRGSASYDFSLFASSGDGPIWPTISGGIRIDRPASRMGTLGLQLYYQYGASWAGTDAGVKRSTINLQLDVRDF
jgi:hypothetical protein